MLAKERQSARYILVDEFQDANFAQVKILSALAGDERNVFAVGDPDQAIYRFRGASSAAFGLFHRHFPGARLVVLEKNQRSTTAILQCAFALIDKNPPVFSGFNEFTASTLGYKRNPLKSARDERAVAEGKTSPPNVAVEVVALSGRDYECADIVRTIEEKRRQLRCRWSDFAVLYRSHFHRDDIARELGEKGIPFTIENMDVLDTPEVRDLLACLGAVDSTADAASLMRVAALPQFKIDPEKFRSAMRAVPRDQTVEQPVTLAVPCAKSKVALRFWSRCARCARRWSEPVPRAWPCSSFWSILSASMRSPALGGYAEICSGLAKKAPDQDR